MATKTVFTSSDDNLELEVYPIESSKEVYIVMYDIESERSVAMALDISTSIRLSKKIRTEINYLKSLDDE